MDEDQNSILYQAIQDQMIPQVDLASRKFISPYEPYNLGVEVYTRSPGGAFDPTRMARPPTDFRGNPSGANTNMRLRPAGETDLMMKNAIEQKALENQPSTAQRVLQYMREMFNANRSPDWWKNF